MYDFQFGDDRTGTHNNHTHISPVGPMAIQANEWHFMCDLQQPATINHKWLARLFCFLEENTSIYRCRLLSPVFFSPTIGRHRLPLSRYSEAAGVIIITPSYAHTVFNLVCKCVVQATHTHTNLPPQKFHIESLKTNTRHTELRLSFILSRLILFVESF